jgi:hypothetical protein
MSGFAAFGQDVPKIEVPVGFSFVNVHPDFSQITSFNLFGGGGAFNVNFGRYWGVKADFMGYTQSSSLTTKLHELGYTGNVNGNVFTYMFGPQIKKHTGVFQPFGEVLVGAAHSNLYATLYDASNGTTMPPVTTTRLLSRPAVALISSSRGILAPVRCRLTIFLRGSV